MNSLSVGSVLFRSLRVVKSHFVSFALLAAIVHVPASLWDFATTASFLEVREDLIERQVEPLEENPEFAAALKRYTLHKALLLIAALLGTALLWSGLLYGVARHLDSNSATASEMIHHGLRRLIPMSALFVTLFIIVVLLAMLLMLFAVTVAVSIWGQDAPQSNPTIAWLMLAAVGFGILPFAAMLYLAFPCLALEGRGIIDAMRRSVALTAGYRVPIAMLILAVTSPILILSVAVAQTTDRWQTEESIAYAAIAGGLAMSILLSIWQAAAMGIVYRDLSSIHKAAGSKERIEDIFR